MRYPKPPALSESRRAFLRGIPVLVNAIATLLFLLAVIAVGLVLVQQRRAEKMAAVQPEAEGGPIPLPGTVAAQ